MDCKMAQQQPNNNCSYHTKCRHLKDKCTLFNLDLLYCFTAELSSVEAVVVEVE